MKDRVREIRQHFDLSQEGFGERIGMSRAGVSRIENGIVNPTTQTIKSICREFGVNYLWLTEGEGDVYRDDNRALHELIDSLMVDATDAERDAFHDLARLDKRYWVAVRDFIKAITDK